MGKLCPLSVAVKRIPVDGANATVSKGRGVGVLGHAIEGSCHVVNWTWYVVDDIGSTLTLSSSQESGSTRMPFKWCAPGDITSCIATTPLPCALVATKFPRTTNIAKNAAIVTSASQTSRRTVSMIVPV